MRTEMMQKPKTNGGPAFVLLTHHEKMILSHYPSNQKPKNKKHYSSNKKNKYNKSIQKEKYLWRFPFFFFWVRSDLIHIV